MPISTFPSLFFFFFFFLLFLLSLQTTSSLHSPAPSPLSPLPPSPTIPPPLPPSSLDSPPSPSPSPSPYISLSPPPEPPSYGFGASFTRVKDAHGESLGKSKPANKAGIAVGVILGAGVIVVGAVVYRKRCHNIERSQYSNTERRELL